MMMMILPCLALLCFALLFLLACCVGFMKRKKMVEVQAINRS